MAKADKQIQKLREYVESALGCPIEKDLPKDVTINGKQYKTSDELFDDFFKAGTNLDSVAQQYGRMFLPNANYSYSDDFETKCRQAFLLNIIEPKTWINSTINLEEALSAASDAANETENLAELSKAHMYCNLSSCKADYKDFCEVRKIANTQDNELTFYVHQQHLNLPTKEIKNVIDAYSSIIAGGFSVDMDIGGSTKNFTFKSMKEVEVFVKIALTDDSTMQNDISKEFNKFSTEFENVAGATREQFAYLALLANYKDTQKMFFHDLNKLDTASNTATLADRTDMNAFAEIFAKAGDNSNLNIKKNTGLTVAEENLYELSARQNNLCDITKPWQSFDDRINAVVQNNKATIFTKTINNEQHYYIPYTTLDGQSNERAEFVVRDKQIYIKLNDGKDFAITSAGLAKLDNAKVFYLSVIDNNHDINKKNERPRVYLPIPESDKGDINKTFQDAVSQLLGSLSISDAVTLPDANALNALIKNNDPLYTSKFTQKVIERRTNEFPEGPLFYNNEKNNTVCFYIPYAIDQKRNFNEYLTFMRTQDNQIYINLGSGDTMKTNLVKGIVERDGKFHLLVQGENNILSDVELNIPTNANPDLLHTIRNLIQNKTLEATKVFDKEDKENFRIQRPNTATVPTGQSQQIYMDEKYVENINGVTTTYYHLTNSDKKFASSFIVKDLDDGKKEQLFVNLIFDNKPITTCAVLDVKENVDASNNHVTTLTVRKNDGSVVDVNWSTDKTDEVYKKVREIYEKKFLDVPEVSLDAFSKIDITQSPADSFANYEKNYKYVKENGEIYYSLVDKASKSSILVKTDASASLQIFINNESYKFVKYSDSQNFVSEDSNNKLRTYLITKDGKDLQTIQIPTALSENVEKLMINALDVEETTDAWRVLNNKQSTLSTTDYFGSLTTPQPFKYEDASGQKYYFIPYQDAPSSPVKFTKIRQDANGDFYVQLDRKDREIKIFADSINIDSFMYTNGKEINTVTGMQDNASTDREYVVNKNLYEKLQAIKNNKITFTNTTKEFAQYLSGHCDIKFSSKATNWNAKSSPVKQVTRITKEKLAKSQNKKGQVLQTITVVGMDVITLLSQKIDLKISGSGERAKVKDQQQVFSTFKSDDIYAIISQTTKNGTEDPIAKIAKDSNNNKVFSYIKEDFLDKNLIVANKDFEVEKFKQSLSKDNGYYTVETSEVTLNEKLNKAVKIDTTSGPITLEYTDVGVNIVNEKGELQATISDNTSIYNVAVSEEFVNNALSVKDPCNISEDMFNPQTGKFSPAFEALLVSLSRQKQSELKSLGTEIKKEEVKIGDNVSLYLIPYMDEKGNPQYFEYFQIKSKDNYGEENIQKYTYAHKINNVSGKDTPGLSKMNSIAITEDIIESKKQYNITVSLENSESYAIQIQNPTIVEPKKNIKGKNDEAKEFDFGGSTSFIAECALEKGLLNEFYVKSDGNEVGTVKYQSGEKKNGLADSQGMAKLPIISGLKQERYSHKEDENVAILRKSENQDAEETSSLIDMTNDDLGEPNQYTSETNTPEKQKVEIRDVEGQGGKELANPHNNDFEDKIDKYAASVAEDKTKTIKFPGDIKMWVSATVLSVALACIFPIFGVFILLTSMGVFGCLLKPELTIHYKERLKHSGLGHALTKARAAERKLYKLNDQIDALQGPIDDLNKKLKDVNKKIKALNDQGPLYSQKNSPQLTTLLQERDRLTAELNRVQARNQPLINDLQAQAFECKLEISKAQNKDYQIALQAQDVFRKGMAQSQKQFKKEFESEPPAIGSADFDNMIVSQFGKKYSLDELNALYDSNTLPEKQKKKLAKFIKYYNLSKEYDGATSDVQSMEIDINATVCYNVANTDGVVDQYSETNKYNIYEEGLTQQEIEERRKKRLQSSHTINDATSAVNSENGRSHE